MDYLASILHTLKFINMFEPYHLLHVTAASFCQRNQPQYINASNEVGGCVWATLQRTNISQLKGTRKSQKITDSKVAWVKTIP